MTQPYTLAFSAARRRIVLAILRARLPSSATVGACGSRSSERASHFYDFDLAIDAGRPRPMARA